MEEEIVSVHSKRDMEPLSDVEEIRLLKSIVIHNVDIESKMLL